MRRLGTVAFDLASSLLALAFLLALASFVTSCATTPPAPPPDPRAVALWRCYGQTDAPPRVSFVPVKSPCVAGFPYRGACVAGLAWDSRTVTVVRGAPGDVDAEALAHELLHAADYRARRPRRCPCTRHPTHADSFYVDFGRCLAATAPTPAPG